MGIPLMYGWMCCNQWEKWTQWDDEDNRVAQDSLRSQIEALRQHPSVFVWANGSDGNPPPEVLAEYHAILSDLHWQNAIVDTVSSLATDAAGERDWDGIQMAGPYSWRPPSYWFAGRYAATRGSTAEQGDNEQIPPFASLKKFIPADKLWPINDAWFFHAGSNPKNAALTSIRRAIDRSLRAVQQRGGVRAQGAAGPLRVDPCPVRGVRRRRLGQPQDDDLLDAQQPLAVVLRAPLRLLPAARWCLLRREEGSAAAVGRLRLVRDGRPRPRQRSPSSTKHPDAHRVCGPGCASTTCRAGCATIAAQAISTCARRHGAGPDVAAARPGFEGLLRPRASCSTRTESASPRTCTGSRSNSTTSAIRATIRRSSSSRSSWADMTALNSMRTGAAGRHRVDECATEATIA